jgi:hypothetical protein
LSISLWSHVVSTSSVRFSVPLLQDAEAAGPVDSQRRMQVGRVLADLGHGPPLAEASADRKFRKGLAMSLDFVNLLRHEKTVFP